MAAVSLPTHERAEGVEIVEVKIYGHSGRQSFQQRQGFKEKMIATYQTTATRQHRKRN
jgi:hypothetical protein